MPKSKFVLFYNSVEFLNCFFKALYITAIGYYEICNINTRTSSSCSQMFFKTGVHKYFANFTGKHLRWSLPLESCRPEGKESQTQMFSCEICENFRSNFFLQNTSGGCFCRAVERNSVRWMYSITCSFFNGTKSFIRALKIKLS